MSQPDWVVELVDRLEPDLQEDFEERAAIMQYDGKIPRDHAECLALLYLLKKYPALLSVSYVEGKNTSQGERQ